MAAEAEALRRRGARRARRAGSSGSGSSKASPRQDYDERLEFELGVIIKMKYPGYFLIVADFIQWAKARDIPVGPGRGSGAGSLVAYCADDHRPRSAALRPALRALPQSRPRVDARLRHRLLPGPAAARSSTTSRQKYGARPRRPDHHLRYAPGPRRAARRRPRAADALWPGRPASTKMVPANPANPVTLAQALEMEPQLKPCATPTRRSPSSSQIAQKLEGLYRHASTHAAGIVIGERPLTELVPMYRDPRSDMPVTQYSLKWVEPAGLVKFDFLGLKTLTTLDIAVKMINRNGTKFDLADIPIDDEKTFEMLDRGRRGRRVPGGIRRHAAGARRHAARPVRGPHRARRALPAGPDGQHPDLLRPQGRARARSSICTRCSSRSSRRPTASSPTRSRCSRSPGRSPATPSPRPISSAAPWARRSRRRWTSQRDRFLDGADRARHRRRARHRPSSMPAPSSPSTGSTSPTRRPTPTSPTRRPTSRRTTPQEFIAASMTLDMGNTDKLSRIPRGRQEARHRGRAARRQPLRGDVHGARRQDLLRHRRDQGRRARRLPSTSSRRAATSPFTDLADFAARVDPRIINRRTLETLVNAGAFDRLVPQREQAFAAIDAVVGTAQRLTDRQVRRHHGHVRLRHARADRAHRATSQPWTLDRAARARVRGHRLPPLGSSARPLRRSVRAAAGHALARVRARRARRAASGRAARRHHRGPQRPPHPQGHADGDR